MMLTHCLCLALALDVAAAPSPKKRPAAAAKAVPAPAAAQPTVPPPAEPSAAAGADGEPAEPNGSYGVNLNEEDELDSSEAAAAAAEPVRQGRRLAVTGEISWNGLAGLGANLAWLVHERVAVDAGLGFGTAGLRLGARGRFNLLTKEWPVVPFVGLGAVYNVGISGDLATFDAGGRLIGFETDAVLFRGPALQATVGVSYMGRTGLFLLSTVGYMHAFAKNPLQPSANGTTVVFNHRLSSGQGSGPVVGFAAGKAF